MPVFERTAALENRHIKKFPASGAGLGVGENPRMQLPHKPEKITGQGLYFVLELSRKSWSARKL
ncbi:MAG: hypothetical protein KA314_06880 [Chloroflexi bacterium]|nr:hypothetical protein [Chloroflexota bacterium]MBP8055549.1 hypothetical protein [Chloroflexota bacterium]